MKKLLTLTIFLLFPLTSFAQNDVCCIMSSAKGNNVSTFADYKSELDCKKGGNTTTYTGAKKICTSLPPDSANCSDRGPEAREKRCTLCGYIWVDNACVVKDLEAENEKLREEKERLQSSKKDKKDS